VRGGDGDRERRSPYLPTGYRLDELAERDFVILRRPDGSEAAAFSVTGAPAGGGLLAASREREHLRDQHDRVPRCLGCRGALPAHTARMGRALPRARGGDWRVVASRVLLVECGGGAPGRGMETSRRSAPLVAPDPRSGRKARGGRGDRARTAAPGAKGTVLGRPALLRHSLPRPRDLNPLRSTSAGRSSPSHRTIAPPAAR
jgi:hypothetical protein